MLRNKYILILIIILTLQSFPISASTNTVRIFLDGKELSFSQNPTIVNNRTMVHIRVILEELGINVIWEKANQQVTCTSNDTTIKLKINDSLASINGLYKYIDSPAVLNGNYTMVPLRFIAENYNLDVKWNQDLFAVFLSTNKESSTSITTSSLNKYETKLALGNYANVVFLGDSTTAVTRHTNGEPNHVDLASDWLDQLYDNKVEVINSGKSGDNIINMLDRLDKDVIAHNPDLVIICSGLNDANGTRHITVDEYEVNYRLVIERILSETDAEILIRTPNPFTITSIANDRLEPYNIVSRGLASEYSLALFDLNALMKVDIASGFLNQTLIMSDSTHPNGIGHKYIFEKFKQYLVY